MKTRTMVILLASFGLAAAAQAYGGSVDFRLDPITGLSLDGSTPAGTVGQWITPNSFSGYTTVRHQWEDHSWSWGQDHYTSDAIPAALRNGAPFGSYERSMPPVGTDSPSAHSLVETNHLRAEWTKENAIDEANASAQWLRAFTLSPNSSVTLSGLATLGLYLPSTLQASFDDHPNWTAKTPHMGVLSLVSSYSTPTVWYNTLNITGRVLNYDPRLTNPPLLGRGPSVDDFSYSTDDQGHLSFTIFNHSNDTLFGSFEVSAFSSAPYIPGVPEPSTWLALLAGLGVLLWRVKPTGGRPLLPSFATPAGSLA